MSGYVNKVILIGNLGKDPESYTMSNGKKMMTFSLATSESWVDKNTNERVSKTEWHNMVVFSESIAKVVENYLKKGSKVYIEGSLRTRKWTDNDGNDKYSTEIVLQGYSCVLRMLDGKREEGELSSGSYGVDENKAKKAMESKMNESLEDDEIPF